MKCFILSILLLLSSYLSFSQGHNLTYYIEQAKTNSPLLQDYQNQILSNQLDSAILRASRRTQVNFISSNSYAPVIKSFGYDEAITNIANVSGIVQANRNFVTKGNLAAQLMTLALQGKALTDTIKLTEQDISRTVTEQYISTYGDQSTKDYYKEIYDLLKKEEVVLKRLTQQSVFKQTDYLNFYVTLQQQELTYLQSELQFNNSYLILNYLAGIVDTSIARIEAPMLNDSLQLNFFNTIYYQRFSTDSLRLSNQRDLISYEYKPRIGAYADAGLLSSMQYTPYRNFGFSAGVSLIVPLYDGNQKKLKMAKVDILERTRQTNKSFYTNQYYQQIAILKQQLNATEALVKKINQQIYFANTLIVANGKLIETGDITMKDYILSINNYLNSKNMLIQNTVSRLRILNQINYWNR